MATPNFFSTVDIWVASFVDYISLREYLSDNYDEFGDDTPSSFRNDFGIFWLDEDFVESAVNTGSLSITKFLTRFSFSELYLVGAVNAANMLGIETAASTILCFDLKSAVSVNDESHARYLGRFLLT